MSSSRLKKKFTESEWNNDKPQHPGEERQFTRKLSREEWRMHKGVVLDLVEYLEEVQGEPKSEQRIQLSVPEGMNKDKFMDKLHDFYETNLKAYTTKGVVDFPYRSEHTQYRSTILKYCWETAHAIYTERHQHDLEVAAEKPAAKAARVAASSSTSKDKKHARRGSSSAGINAALVASSTRPSSAYSSSSSSASSPEDSAAAAAMPASSLFSSFFSLAPSSASADRAKKLAELKAANAKAAAENARLEAELKAKAKELEAQALQNMDEEIELQDAEAERLRLEKERFQLQAAQLLHFAQQAHAHPAMVASVANANDEDQGFDARPQRRMS